MALLAGGRFALGLDPVGMSSMDRESPQRPHHHYGGRSQWCTPGSVVSGHPTDVEPRTFRSDVGVEAETAVGEEPKQVAQRSDLIGGDWVVVVLRGLRDLLGVADLERRRQFADAFG